jgi:hypothetical protein
MRVAKTSDEEITRLNTLLQEIEWLSKDFRSGNDFAYINWDDYENLKDLPKEEAEDFLKVLCHKIAGNHFGRIFMNCITLLENCADKNLDYLDFNPQIKAGFEAFELLEELAKRTAPIGNNASAISPIHQKISDFLEKHKEFVGAGE